MSNSLVPPIKLNNTTSNLPVDIKKAKKIMEEVAEYFGGKKMQHRMENPVWHKDDPNTWLHTKKVAQNAWAIPSPEGYTKQDQMVAALGHDFGKMLSGDGHAEVSYNLIKLIFPDATEEQLNAIRRHMDPLEAIENKLEIATKYSDLGVIPGADLSTLGLTPEEISSIEKTKWFKKGGKLIPKAANGIKTAEKVLKPKQLSLFPEIEEQVLILKKAKNSERAQKAVTTKKKKYLEKPEYEREHLEDLKKLIKKLKLLEKDVIASQKAIASGKFVPETKWNPEEWLQMRRKMDLYDPSLSPLESYGKPKSALNPKGYTMEDIELFKEHIPELLALEYRAKKEGTWMKNSNNSDYEGDPRVWLMWKLEGTKHANPQTLWSFRGDDVSSFSTADYEIWATPENNIFSENGKRYWPFRTSTSGFLYYDAEGLLCSHINVNGNFKRTDDLVYESLSPFGVIIDNVDEATPSGQIENTDFAKKIVTDYVLKKLHPRWFLYGNTGNFNIGFNKFGGKLIKKASLGAQLSSAVKQSLVKAPKLSESAKLFEGPIETLMTIGHPRIAPKNGSLAEIVKNASGKFEAQTIDRGIPSAVTRGVTFAATKEHEMLLKYLFRNFDSDFKFVEDCLANKKLLPESKKYLQEVHEAMLDLMNRIEKGENPFEVLGNYIQEVRINKGLFDDRLQITTIDSLFNKYGAIPILDYEKIGENTLLYRGTPDLLATDSRKGLLYFKPEKQGGFMERAGENTLYTDTDELGRINYGNYDTISGEFLVPAASKLNLKKPISVKDSGLPVLELGRTMDSHVMDTSKIRLGFNVMQTNQPIITSTYILDNRFIDKDVLGKLSYNKIGGKLIEKGQKGLKAFSWLDSLGDYTRIPEILDSRKLEVAGQLTANILGISKKKAIAKLTEGSLTRPIYEAIGTIQGRNSNSTGRKILDLLGSNKKVPKQMWDDLRKSEEGRKLYNRLKKSKKFGKEVRAADSKIKFGENVSQAILDFEVNLRLVAEGVASLETTVPSKSLTKLLEKASKNTNDERVILLLLVVRDCYQNNKPLPQEFVTYIGSIFKSPEAVVKTKQTSELVSLGKFKSNPNLEITPEISEKLDIAMSSLKDINEGHFNTSLDLLKENYIKHGGVSLNFLDNTEVTSAFRKYFGEEEWIKAANRQIGDIKKIEAPSIKEIQEYASSGKVPDRFLEKYHNVPETDTLYKYYLMSNENIGDMRFLAAIALKSLDDAIAVGAAPKNAKIEIKLITGGTTKAYPVIDEAGELKFGKDTVGNNPVGYAFGYTDEKGNFNTANNDWTISNKELHHTEALSDLMSEIFIRYPDIKDPNELLKKYKEWVPDNLYDLFLLLLKPLHVGVEGLHHNDVLEILDLARRKSLSRSNLFRESVSTTQGKLGSLASRNAFYDEIYKERLAVNSAGGDLEQIPIIKRKLEDPKMLETYAHERLRIRHLDSTLLKRAKEATKYNKGIENLTNSAQKAAFNISLENIPVTNETLNIWRNDITKAPALVYDILATFDNETILLYNLLSAPSAENILDAVKSINLLFSKNGDILETPTENLLQLYKRQNFED